LVINLLFFYRFKYLSMGLLKYRSCKRFHIEMICVKSFKSALRVYEPGAGVVKKFSVSYNPV